MSGTLAEIRTEYLSNTLSSYSNPPIIMERIQRQHKEQTFMRHDGNNDDSIGPSRV